MAQPTDTQLELLKSLQHHDGGKILRSGQYFDCKPLEDAEYVTIIVFSPTQFLCKITDLGRATLTKKHREEILGVLHT